MTRRKRVGVDATSLFVKNRRGMAKSLWELYSRTVNIAPEYDFYFYYEKAFEEFSPWGAIPCNVVLRPLSMRGDRYQLWRNVRLPLALIADHIDMMHCPAQVTPFFKTIPIVLTVHDIIPMVIDEGLGKHEVSKFIRQTTFSLKRASHVIAISHYTKDQLYSELGDAIHCPVDVVHWGSPAIRIEENELIRSESGSTQLSFFALGGDSPRKNTKNLLLGFIEFLSVEPASYLVISGLQDKSMQDCMQILSSYPCSQKQVSLLGYISDRELLTHMRTATAFVFPSLYEGFGLPVLEAMSLGTPVIASRNTAISEVGGDAPLYSGGGSSGDICRALTQFSKMGAGERADMVDRGYARVKSFDYDDTAKKTLEIFKMYL